MWVIGLVLLGFIGAALFYLPYLGVTGQIQLTCPLCPHVSALGDPKIKFLRYTLVGGVMNATSFLAFGGVVRLLLVGWQKLRTYWT
jgi:hypothetical protein